MARHGRRLLAIGLACLLGGGAGVYGQAAPAQAADAAARPDLTLLQLLAANPTTAPYRYGAALKNGRVELSGRVATKAVHDAAVQTAIAAGIQVIDRLVIDTAEAVRALPARGPIAMIDRAPAWGPGYFYNNTYGSFVSPDGIPYLYPSPLFGRLDDPLFGLEPPAISYPPYWGALTARRLADSGPSARAQAPFPGPIERAPSLPEAVATPSGGQPSRGQVEMIIDPRGVALLKGEVATLADKILVGQRAAQAPGVTEVRNEIAVREPSAADDAAPGGARIDVAPAAPNVPPPPPAPPDPAAANPPIRPAADPVADRLSTALARDPLLNGKTIGVAVRDGVATITGRLPGPLEAMRAYRTAEKTPGVREVVDRLEFPVPEEGRPNPLRNGPPEDLEPYLLAQARRQVGDLANFDRLRLDGDRVEIRGRPAREADRPRVEAILRPMPLLRGFALDLRLEAGDDR